MLPCQSRLNVSSTFPQRFPPVLNHFYQLSLESISGRLLGMRSGGRVHDPWPQSPYWLDRDVLLSRWGHMTEHCQGPWGNRRAHCLPRGRPTATLSNAVRPLTLERTQCCVYLPWCLRSRSIMFDCSIFTPPNHYQTKKARRNTVFNNMFYCYLLHTTHYTTLL